MQVAGSVVTGRKGISAWLKGLWPVESHEWTKFLPLFLMKMCISFNYTVLQSTKDTVVVTGSGAEVIPVLKGGVVIVIAFLVMLLYSKLSNIFASHRLFYIVITPFLFFFLAYGIFLFPNRELLSPVRSADWLATVLGEGRNHWVGIYRYWMNSLFFVFAELWGGLVIGVLFWGFANQVNSLRDAARFYALYTAGGHIGTMIAGGSVYLYSNAVLKQNYNITVFVLMTIVVLVGVCIVLLYGWGARVAYKDVMIHDGAAHGTRVGGISTKLGLWDSISYVVRSRYLGLLALMVIGYGLSVNLVEVPWKALLKIAYPQQNEYQAYMGVLQFSIGVISLLISVLFGSKVINKRGWLFTAILTPAALSVTSLLFFGIYFIFPDYAITTVTICSLSPLMLLVIVGTLHNVVCKATKYCLFDPTKEMAYIPLDLEAKVKGKAAVDLVGSRFGKSGASWLQLLLIDVVGGGSILSVLPLLAPCVLLMVACWVRAVINLNRRFLDLQQHLSVDTSASMDIEAGSIKVTGAGKPTSTPALA